MIGHKKKCKNSHLHFLNSNIPKVEPDPTSHGTHFCGTLQKLGFTQEHSSYESSERDKETEQWVYCTESDVRVFGVPGGGLESGGVDLEAE